VDQKRGKIDFEPWLCDNEECKHVECLHHPENGEFDGYTCDKCDGCHDCEEEDGMEPDDEGSLDISLHALQSLSEGCYVIQQNLSAMMMEIIAAQKKIAEAVYDEVNDDDEEE
jgi:hypothetical protein